MQQKPACDSCFPLAFGVFSRISLSLQFLEAPWADHFPLSPRFTQPCSVPGNLIWGELPSPCPMGSPAEIRRSKGSQVRASIPQPCPPLISLFPSLPGFREAPIHCTSPCVSGGTYRGPFQPISPLSISSGILIDKTQDRKDCSLSKNSVYLAVLFSNLITYWEDHLISQVQ